MKTYTISEVVELTGLVDKTIRRHIQSGKLVAEKEPGPRGMEYRITQEALDSWLEARQDPSKDGVQGTDQSDQGVLVPFGRVQELQVQLSNAAYRAGQAEGQLKQIESEMDRLLLERNEERIRFEAQVRDLEEQKQQLLEKSEQLQQQFHEKMTAVIEQQHARDKELEEIAAARDTRIIEFIEQQRRKEGEIKKPWWQFWK